MTVNTSISTVNDLSYVIYISFIIVVVIFLL